MSRQLTTDEVKQQFITKVRSLIHYWSYTTPPPDILAKERLMTPQQVIERRVSGVVHSLLATLDGCAVDICGFRIIPHPCAEDEEYCKEQGINYYPRFENILDESAQAYFDSLDIGGVLHELLHKKDL